MTQAYQVPHSLTGELLGSGYAATLQALLLLPLPRDCPEPCRSEVHQADAAAASHSSHFSSPPALQSSDHSAAAVPETAATPPESRGSAAAPGDAIAPELRAQQGPVVPHAALSMAHGLPAAEAQPVMPAMAHDATSASTQLAAEVPVALPMEEDCLSESQHAGREDVHGQGQHGGCQHGIGTASAPLADRGTNGRQCCAEKTERQARCAVLVPCCEAVHGRFPLNGTYFQTNEVFLDASSLDHPIVVSHSDRPDTQHPKQCMSPSVFSLAKRHCS